MRTASHGLSLVSSQPLAVDQSRLRVERTPAATDNDSVTAQTIGEMCRYIRESLSDPLVARAAAQARQNFGSGNIAGNDGERSRAALDLWGVFWFIKHLVKFRLDEGSLLEYHGERDQQDFLVAPHVLLRMRKPQEDCDGFAMLTCALLTLLGVPAYLVTVAVDPSDPERWSHVFAAAMIDGAPVACDATPHGTHPGWMVPDADIYRLQVWDLNGRKTELPWKARRRSTLHGYMKVGFRGLGQTSCPTVDPETGALSDPCAEAAAAAPPPVVSTYTCPDGSVAPASGVCPSPVPTTGGGITPAQIASLVSSAGSAVSNTLRSISAPAGYVFNPATGQYVPAVAGAVNLSSLGSLVPILGIGLLAVLLIGSMGKR